MMSLLLRNESGRRYRMPLMGLEAALGSALLLLIAYLWSEAIIGHGGLQRLSSIDSPREFWIGLEVLLKTGLLWLIGGFGAIVFWPIVAIHLTFRILAFLLDCAIALRKSKRIEDIS